MGFESTLGNRTENVRPYALFGDNTKGDFFGKAIKTGSFSLEATAYTKKGGKGEAIATAELDYTIIDQAQPQRQMMDRVLGADQGVAGDADALLLPAPEGTSGHRDNDSMMPSDMMTAAVQAIPVVNDLDGADLQLGGSTAGMGAQGQEGLYLQSDLSDAGSALVAWDAPTTTDVVM